MNLNEILAKDPTKITEAERAFLVKNTFNLTREQCKKFNIPVGDDEDDDDDEDDEDDEDGDGDEDDDDEDDEDDDDLDDIEDADVTPDKFRQVNAQRKHHKKKRESAEQERDDLKRRIEALEKKGSKKSQKGKQNSADDGDEARYDRERSDFRFDYPDLKTKTVDQIEAYARAKGISLREAAKDSLVKSMIRRAKKKAAVDKASAPTGSYRPGSVKSKRKDWSGATSEEMKQERLRRQNARE